MARSPRLPIFSDPGKSAPHPGFENRFRELGFRRIAGVDEAGRGPLAGPVVAAAVVLPEHLAPGSPLLELRDSKTLSAKKREAMYETIAELAVDLAWDACGPEEIDRLNILAASLEAMRRAVMALAPVPELCLVDGNHGLPGRVLSVPVVKGDRLCLSIAAASIVAKVVRDQIMDELHRRFPGYGFDAHRGYPTLAHRRALLELGPCPVHRKTFRGVKETVADRE